MIIVINFDNGKKILIVKGCKYTKMVHATINWGLYLKGVLNSLFLKGGG